MSKRKSLKTSDKRLTREVLGVLTDQWQTASLISCQISFAPDAVERVRVYYERPGTVKGAKSWIVARCLHELVRRGKAEKQKISPVVNEYRLAQKQPSEDTK